MGRRRQPWRVGDVFLIETADGLFSPGQVVGREPEVLNSVTVALFRHRLAAVTDVVSLELEASAAISVVFTTRDLLDAGDWRVLANRPLAISQEQLPHEDVRASGFVGAKVYGSGILMKFLDAYFGLAPWDDFHDPNYLDRLLLSPTLKPPNVVSKGS